ncbi:GNAT family N-acetyltransferase [Halobacteriales archaeon QH_2_66_30]|nr:MAG: GNAT family N-acetyltransferase [Halobacteriales archaeon QH_2_66_30]
MEGLEKPSFDHKDRRDIYEHVERNGAMRPDDVRTALGMDARQFGHHVAILKRDNILEERDGKLRIAYEAGAEEEYETDDISFTIRQAREEDLTGLVGAIRQAIGSGEYVRAETVADVVDNEGVLLRHNEIESRIFFVATVDSEVVGWVHLRHGLEWAKQHGFEKIENALPATNEKAIEFLEERGFEVEAVREDHYKLDGTYVDEVMMATKL